MLPDAEYIVGLIEIAGSQEAAAPMPAALSDEDANLGQSLARLAGQAVQRSNQAARYAVPAAVDERQPDQRPAAPLPCSCDPLLPLWYFQRIEANLRLLRHDLDARASLAAARRADLSGAS